MKKNILKIAIVAAFALIAGINVYNARKSVGLSDLALANVEALASFEDNAERKYATRRESSVEIWDNASGTFKKLTTIECEGRGNLVC